MERFTDRWSHVGKHGSDEHEFIGLADIIYFLKLYWRSISAFVAAGLLLAWLYNVTSPSRFTATAQILIEPRVPHILQQPAEVNLSLDTARIESQIAVMQSEKIAAMVIDELKLTGELEFNRSSSPSLRERLLDLAAFVDSAAGIGRFYTEAPQDPFKDSWNEMTDFERSRLTMTRFLEGLDVRRVGVSYVISLAFTSLDPDTASRVANSIASAFVREQIETKAAAAREGGAWLERRLQELRTRMNSAMKIAQEFRSRHDYSVEFQRDDRQGVGDYVPGTTLEELEVTADTYRKMYESFLQAYTNSESQQSYPVADARVITPATPPLYPSAPRPKLTLFLGALAGIAAGVMLAFGRYSLDRTVRTPRQIREELGVDCVVELPAFGGKQSDAQFREVTRSPRSRFTQGLKRIKHSVSLADTAHPVRLLGVASTAQSRTSSVIVANLAALYSLGGMRTLVLDADIHGKDPTGLAAFAAERPIRQVTVAPDISFDVMPGLAAECGKPAGTRWQLPPAVHAYDIVIANQRAFASGSRRGASSPSLDGIILVAEWGKTHMDSLRELARSMHASKTPIIGVLLTNVRVRSASGPASYDSARATHTAGIGPWA